MHSCLIMKMLDETYNPRLSDLKFLSPPYKFPFSVCVGGGGRYSG